MRVLRRNKKKKTVPKKRRGSVEQFPDFPQSLRRVRKRKFSQISGDHVVKDLARSAGHAHMGLDGLRLSLASSLEFTQPCRDKMSKTSEQCPQQDGSKPVTPPSERWDTDSGFSSEGSLPASGRSSPSVWMSPDRLVAMDCEMVGTGPGGQCNELARCSLVGYSGIVLYDKYILPRHPVTDYHTGWRGITEHHLIRALPFEEARKEILQILKGKVVIGHALHNDFRALEFIPPRHLIRDTSRMHCLRDMCGVPVKACVPLKTLAQKLLSREIQGDRLGHCSVEDARIALELYKLVEEQWEADMASTVSDSDLLLSPSFTPEHYMQGWLDHMMDCSQ